jgi:hypothetical protein
MLIRVNRLFATTLLLIAFPSLSGTAALASSSLLSDGGPAQMAIDILPGNANNSIDLGKQRMLPVAILGSASFDIDDFNPRTLKLKASSQNLVGKSDKTLCTKKDINADNFTDLVCNIKTIGFNVQPGEIEVTISAGTYQRQSLRAVGVIRYVVE